MDALAIGALIALAPRLGIPSLWLPRVSPWAVTLSFSCLAMIWWPKADLDRFNDPVFGIYGYTLLAVFWGAAMLTALSYASGNPVRKILECGTLRFFGKYSYGLYVLHWPLLVFFNEQMELLNWFERKLASRTLAAVLFDAVALVTCVVAAYLCYHSFERRFLDLKRHFDYRNP